MEFHQLRGLGAVPPAERLLPDRLPVRAVPESTAAAAEAVLRDAVRGDQAELPGGDEAGELTEHAVHQRAPAARASAYVENPTHEFIVMGSHTRSPAVPRRRNDPLPPCHSGLPGTPMVPGSPIRQL